MAEPHIDYYRIGIQRLLEGIGLNHPSYADVLVFQQRLEENLFYTNQFGPTQSRLAERAQILDGCNRLSMSITGHTLYYFCGLWELPSSPRARADDLFREATHHQVQGDLGYALQLYRLVQQLDSTYPRIDATIGAVEREMRAPYVDQHGYVSEQRLMRFPAPASMPAPSAQLPRRRHERFAYPRFVLIAGLVIVIVVVLLILLYLWLQGALG